MFADTFTVRQLNITHLSEGIPNLYLNNELKLITYG